jgi:hypothetical protein
MSFFKDFWEQQRDFTLALIGDLFRLIVTLAGLFVVYGFAKIAEMSGYDKFKLDVLEWTDFAVAATLVSGFYFVGRLIVREKKEMPAVVHKGAGKSPRTGRGADK